jgi:hypothetical protein
MTVWVYKPLTVEVGKRWTNPQNKGKRKDVHPQYNHSKPPTKKDNGKTKKDTGKWYKFHMIP